METFTVTATKDSHIHQGRVVAYTPRQAAYIFKRHNPASKIIGIRLTTHQ